MDEESNHGIAKSKTRIDFPQKQSRRREFMTLGAHIIQTGREMTRRVISDGIRYTRIFIYCSYITVMELTENFHGAHYSLYAAS